MAQSEATKHRGRADFAFTYRDTKWKWSEEFGVWAPDNDAAARVSKLSPDLLATYGQVRGAVNRYGKDTSKRSTTEAQGSLTVRQVLREVGCPADKIDIACAIVHAESNGDATVVNTNSDQWHSKDVGLAQINLHWHPEYTETEMKEPRANLRAMGKVSNGWKDFSPWTTYRLGLHLVFLGQDLKITHATDSVGPGEPDSVLESAGKVLTGGAGDLGRIADGVASLVQALFTPSTYFRLGKGLLGVIMLLMCVLYLLKNRK